MTPFVDCQLTDLPWYIVEQENWNVMLTKAKKEYGALDASIEQINTQLTAGLTFIRTYYPIFCPPMAQRLIVDIVNESLAQLSAYRYDFANFMHGRVLMEA
jgi:hypothetical protein